MIQSLVLSMDIVIGNLLMNRRQWYPPDEALRWLRKRKNLIPRPLKGYLRGWVSYMISQYLKVWNRSHSFNLLIDLCNDQGYLIICWSWVHNHQFENDTLLSYGNKIYYVGFLCEEEALKKSIGLGLIICRCS